MIRYISILFLVLSIYNTSNADATLLGSSSTHLMFDYHGEPLFCPRDIDTFDMVTCIDGSLKYVVCRILPRELGYIDCGHKTKELLLEGIISIKYIKIKNSRKMIGC